MELSILAVFLTLFSFTLGQLQGLPKCAQQCVGTSFGSCGALDVKCICGNSNLISDMACCVSQKCTQDDADKTIQFANGICKAYNIQVQSSAFCSSTPTPDPTNKVPNNSTVTLTGRPTITPNPTSSPTGNAAAGYGSVVGNSLLFVALTGILAYL